MTLTNQRWQSTVLPRKSPRSIPPCILSPSILSVLGACVVSVARFFRRVTKPISQTTHCRLSLPLNRELRMPVSQPAPTTTTRQLAESGVGLVCTLQASAARSCIRPFPSRFHANTLPGPSQTVPPCALRRVPACSMLVGMVLSFSLLAKPRPFRPARCRLQPTPPTDINFSP